MDSLKVETRTEKVERLLLGGRCQLCRPGLKWTCCAEEWRSPACYREFCDHEIGRREGAGWYFCRECAKDERNTEANLSR